MRKRMKNIALLALSLVVLGNTIAPMEVSAAEEGTTGSFGKEEVVDKIVYEAVDVSVFEGLFGVEAPEKVGYYFGGWYVNQPDEGETDADCTAIKYTSQKEEIVKDNPNGVVYAKFVPSYMMNVKVQNSAKIQKTNSKGNSWEKAFIEKNSTLFDATNTTKIRMISAIDSTRYQEVGFHVFVNGNRAWAKVESKYNKTVYSKINIANSDGVIERSHTAKELFGLNSENYDPKLIIANFSNIPEKGWKTSIFVRPYWVTFDGIEVRGNGRYIHVEDGIKGYVTVPINLQGNSEELEGIVAGTLDVKYDSTKLTYVDTIQFNDGEYKDTGYKAGADLNTVIVKQSSVIDENNSNLTKIKCAAIRKIAGDMEEITPNEYAAKKRVGSTTSDEYKNSAANTYEAVNNMYVTLRFKPTEAYKNEGGFLEFYISNTTFCDYGDTEVNNKEKIVPIDVWDVRY